jgi:hypothetical protein
MFKTILSFIFICIFSFSLYGKRLKGDSGIAEEYSKVDEFDKNLKVTEEYKLNTLKTNLIRAIKISIQKKFPDYESRLQDIDHSTIKFEQIRGTFNYYAKFKDYLFLFKFPIDPELYIQRPIEETILVKSMYSEEDLADTSLPNDAKNPKNTKDQNKSERGFDKFNKEP